MSLSTAVMIGAAMFAQTGGAPGPTGAADPAAHNALEVSSVLDFMIRGGWPMVPIAICSLVALTIIIERAMVIRRGRFVPRAFVQRMSALAGDRAKAMELARSNSSPIARVFEEALRRADEPQEMLEKHVEEVGGRELVALRSRMRVLSALPQVSTMLGLLGTVFGMIKTFQQVAASSEALGKTERLADGIFEAWTCTAGGIMVAIPVLIAFHWLMGKIDQVTADADQAASEFVDRMRSSAAASHTIAMARTVDPARANGTVRTDGLPAAPVTPAAIGG